MAAASALSTCQLVEHSLKLYLATAHNLIKRKILGQMPYHFSGDDYDELPMRALLRAFNKLNDNSDLQKQLEVFRKERNWVAHQLFADYFKRVEADKTTHHQSSILKRLAKIEEDAAKLISQVMIEVRDVRVKCGEPEIDLVAVMMKAQAETEGTT